MPHRAHPENRCPFFFSECRPYCEPVLISACLLGIPCRWHGRRPQRRDGLIEQLKRHCVLVPVCPEQLGGMPTPRTGEKRCKEARAARLWIADGGSSRRKREKMSLSII